MRLSLMQPYFFPYVQQFRHIAQCDLWVVFDTVRYRRRTWTTRNRILNREKGWSYVKVPMQHDATQETLCRAQLMDRPSALAAVLRSLEVYRGKAQFLEAARTLVSETFDFSGESIADLTTAGLRTVCAYLGIRTPIVRLSELGLQLPANAEPAEWGLLVTKALGASIYSNAPGGRSLYRPDVYERAGIQLEFYEPIDFRYETADFTFVPDLSVLDSLMWLSQGELRDRVSSCTGQSVEPGRTGSC